jgi:molybdenum cofactor biosynthesis protein B
MSDVPAEHRAYAPATLGIATLTVSDSRTPETDTAGRAIRDLASAAGWRVVACELVPDEETRIQTAVRALLALDGVDLVAVTGGTGFAPRDVTVEAVEELLDRQITGFGELFRMLSYQEVKAAAMLSRATAGLVGDRAVFVLPGSPQAAALAMEKLILPEAGHLIAQARRLHRPPPSS